MPVKPPAFALFTETLLTGVIVGALSIPIITALPAIAAGVAHLRRHIEGRADPIAGIFADFRVFLRGSWAFGIGGPVLFALLILNLDIATATQIPGAALVTWVSLALVAVLLVIALRMCALRSAQADLSWPTAARTAARRSAADPGGSVLILVAVGLCVVFVWMLKVLVLLTPGLLVLAVLAVEHRYNRRNRP